MLTLLTRLLIVLTRLLILLTRLLALLTRLLILLMRLLTCAELELVMEQLSLVDAAVKDMVQVFLSLPRKVDIRLPGKVNSNSHGARPVHPIITMIKWIRTSRLSMKNSLCIELVMEQLSLVDAAVKDMVQVSPSLSYLSLSLPVC